MKSTSTLLYLLAGALLSTGLQAADLRWGLQATLSFPTSDLGDKPLLDQSLGYGLGAHAVLDFHGGHALVPRLDYTYFEKGSPTRKVQMAQLGVDYTYYFSRKVSEGAYLGVGAGYGMARFDIHGAAGSDTDTPGAFVPSAVAGYMFTPRMGCELRYSWAKYEPELFGAKPGITSPTVNASFLFRF